MTESQQQHNKAAYESALIFKGTHIMIDGKTYRIQYEGKGIFAGYIGVYLENEIGQETFRLYDCVHEEFID